MDQSKETKFHAIYQGHLTRRLLKTQRASATKIQRTFCQRYLTPDEQFQHRIRSLTLPQQAHLTKCRQEMEFYRKKQADSATPKEPLGTSDGSKKVHVENFATGEGIDVDPSEAYHTPCCGKDYYLPTLLTYIRRNAHLSVKQDLETFRTKEAQHFCPNCRRSLPIEIDMLKRGMSFWPGAQINPVFRDLRRRPFAGQSDPKPKRDDLDPSGLRNALHRIGIVGPVRMLDLGEMSVQPVLRTSSDPRAERARHPERGRSEADFRFVRLQRERSAVSGASSASHPRSISEIPDKLRSPHPINDVTGTGMKSALAVAVKRADVESVITLLNHGADPNAIDIYGFPLITYLVKQRKINHHTGMPKEEDGIRRTRKFDKVLKERRVITVTYHEKEYNTRLFQIAEILLRNGARLDVATPLSCYPLFFAAKYNDTQLVRLLLSYRASVDAPNYRKNTALHTAAEHSSFESMRILLDHGASLQAKTDDGETPFHYVVNPCRYLELSDKNVNPIDVPVLRFDPPTQKRFLSAEGVRMFISEAKRRGCLKECVTCPRREDHKTVLDLMQESESFRRLLPLVTASK